MISHPIFDERRLEGRAGSGPVTETERIMTLDLIRGVAVLGMLLMNAVAINLGMAAYANLSAAGTETWLDWSIAIFGEILIDQKFMGLFSLLFGAGILLFIDRVEKRESHPMLLNLWRNLLLLGIGLAHALLRDGDILMIYAISAAFLVALRKLPTKALIAGGAVVFLLSVPVNLMMHYIATSTDVPLTGVWELGSIEGPQMMLRMWLDGSIEGGLTLFLCNNMEELTLLGYFLRALGLILMGAGLYRLGFMHGHFTASTYRRIAIIGLGIGLPLSAIGVAATALGGYSREVAFAGQIPNTVGTIPATLGLMSLIIYWGLGRDNWLKQRLRATGQMSLTNYLAQSALTILILNVLLAEYTLTRTGILAFCLAVWAAQLWWSPFWLKHYRFGPVEWIWRAATYRKWQPLCRSATPPYLGHPVGVQ